jgi:valyl-tRNA synthetase
MVMTGLDFMNEIPFRDVYIHATVLDEKGERMSKSKGNGIDPIDLIDKYGADSTRFSLLQQAGKNQDIKYSEQRTEIAANFCNKLWNASRFVLMSLADTSGASSDPTDLPYRIDTTDSSHTSTAYLIPPPEQLSIADRWILSRLNAAVSAVNSAFGSYDMDDSTRAIYEFFWNEFCDWYVEMAKPRLRGTPEARAAAQQMLAAVLETTLRLMHPLMPFMTEEIWQALTQLRGPAAQLQTDGTGPVSLSIAPYPEPQSDWNDPAAEAQMGVLIEATRALRNLRAELGIAPGARLQAQAVPSSADARRTLDENKELIAELAKLSALSISQTAPDPTTGKWIGTPVSGAQVFLEIGDAMDIGKELARIDKELAEVDKQVSRCEGMLDNPSFTERAPAEKIQQERDRLAGWLEKRSGLQERRRQFAP